MTRYAILLSVEDYSNFSKTAFAHADAILLRRTLLEHCDFAEQHVLSLQLTLEGHHTPASILAQVKQTASQLVDGDTILFFFAGHGHLHKSETFLILPEADLDALDATALPLRDLMNELRVARCGCFRILDACHSGTDTRAGDGLNSQAFVDQLARGVPMGWVTLAACASDEFSVADPAIGHGVFTYHLCEAIRSTADGKPVLPENLKIALTPCVEEHAQRLGNRQTPTLNASISGNLSLATKAARRVQPAKAPEYTLVDRIMTLRKVNDILTNEKLGQYLTRLADGVEAALKAAIVLEGPIERGKPLKAGSIPAGMHRTIVEFTRAQGLSTRHAHVQTEDPSRSDRSSIGFIDLGISALFNRAPISYSYSVDQPHELPESAVVIDVKGDGRCVPFVSVLVYVVPLQLCCCLVVSGFRFPWSPRFAPMELLHTSYRILRPQDSLDEIDVLASFAVDKLHGPLEEHVRQRVVQLEKELSAR